MKRLIFILFVLLLASCDAADSTIYSDNGEIYKVKRIRKGGYKAFVHLECGMNLTFKTDSLFQVGDSVRIMKFNSK